MCSDNPPYTPPRPVMSDEYLRSFGRVLGRKMTDNLAMLIDELLPVVSLDVGGDQPLALSDVMGQYQQLWIELGFGGGEHLAAQAIDHENVAMIGCEPYINGVASLLKQIDEQVLDNIRIVHGDGRLLLEKLPDACVDRFFILFPDPWPKAKHHKKRIVNAQTLGLLAKVMKPKATLTIATDHEDYAQWISEQLAQANDFVLTNAQNPLTPPQDWVPTRYQKKAEKQGCKAQFFVLDRKA